MLRDLIAKIGLCIFVALSISAFIYPIDLTFFYLSLAGITATSCYIAYSMRKNPPEDNDQISVVHSSKLIDDDVQNILRSVGEDEGKKTALSTSRERGREKRKRETKRRERIKKKAREKKTAATIEEKTGRKPEEGDSLFQEAQEILKE